MLLMTYFSENVEISYYECENRPKQRCNYNNKEIGLLFVAVTRRESSCFKTRFEFIKDPYVSLQEPNPTKGNANRSFEELSTVPQFSVRSLRS